MSTTGTKNPYVKYLPGDYHKLFAVALLALGEIIVEGKDAGKTKTAMKARLTRRRRYITGKDGFAIPKEEIAGKRKLQRYLSDNCTKPDVVRWLLVDCSFADPFVAVEGEEPIEVSQERRIKALATLADWCALERPKSEVARLEATIESVVDSQKEFWQKGIFWFFAAIVIALATGGLGLLAAPLIGGAIGATLGLSGAAATSAGLAALGGGSLAVGGAGMAGGIALITGIGALAGGLAGGVAGGVAMAGDMDEGQLRGEVMKLQTTFGFVLMRKGSGKENRAAAKQMISDLKSLRKEVKSAKKMKDRDKKLTSLDRAINWMSDFPS